MLKPYQGLFGAYTRKYLAELIPRELRSMAGLKVVHTQRVRKEMKRLGTVIGLEGHALFLAELAGLFHDIGRFEQLRRFGTFVDADSVNHAALSVEVVLKEGFLKDLQPADCSAVVAAISRHNMRSVPPSANWIENVLTLMLRDADKLDIWRVFHEHYTMGRYGNDSTLELNKPDTPGISSQVASCIMQGSIVDLVYVKNRNDFAMVRLAWVFDINFIPTLKEIEKRGYIAAMEKHLPDFEKKEELFQRVSGYVNDMIARNSPVC
jgi:hypothetical protein